MSNDLDLVIQIPHDRLSRTTVDNAGATAESESKPAFPL